MLLTISNLNLNALLNCMYLPCHIAVPIWTGTGAVCRVLTPWGVVGTLTLTSMVLLLTLSSGTRKYRYQCVYGYPLTPGRILEKKKYVYGYSSVLEIGFLGKTHFHIHILTWTMNWIWIVNNWYVDKKARKYRSKINNLVNIILYYWIDGIFRNAFSFKLYFRN